MGHLSTLALPASKNREREREEKAELDRLTESTGCTDGEGL